MKRSLITAAGTAAVFLLSGSPFAAAMQLAQVEVIESSPTIRAIGQPRNTAPRGTTSAPSVPTATADSDIQAELYNQLQVLQEEVQMLRGLVEEQSYQLQQLKQQRIDDYTDLDRRVSQLTQSGAGASRSGASAGSNSSASAGSQRATGEFDSYSAAVDLATRQQEFEKAIVALQEHLNNYPDGRYAGNAHYWLGQIYFVQGNLEEAQESFSRVMRDYPNHNKAAESKYKLGQIYFRQGNQARAKILLQEVANGNSESAPLARNFLQQNFPN